jgi:DNA ligase 1
MKQAELWKPMLAAKPDPDHLDEELAKLPLPALFSPKLDGIRATVQNGRLYSRSLKLIPNQEMQKLWGRKELDGLDGEIVVGPPTAPDCFSQSTSTVMSRDKSAANAVFYMFDMMGPECFEERLEKVEYRLIYDAIQIEALLHVMLRNADALAKYEAKMKRLGYEGIMRRDPNGLYKHGRSTMKEGGLVAIKRFTDAEAVVLDVYEQQENTNEKTLNELGQSKRSSHKAGKVGKGTLGGFVVVPLKCDCPNCSRLLSALVSCERKFNIGTGLGLTEAKRLELWKDSKRLVGKVVKYRFQACGTKDAPRIPILLGFRDGRDL